MKILNIVGSMDPELGGLAQMIRSVSAIHHEMGHEVDVLSLDAPDSGIPEDAAFRLIAVGPGKYGWGYCKGLKSWLKAHLNEYDGVIMHGLWQYPSIAVADVISELRRQEKATPVFFAFPHGMLDPWFQSWKRRPLKTFRNLLYWHLFENRVIRSADTMLFTCLTEVRLGTKTFHRYRAKKNLAIPFGCTAPPPETEAMQIAFRNNCPNLEDAPYWLFISRIHPKKGVDLLVKAYCKKLQESISSSLSFPHLVIAGPGLNTPYGRLITELASSHPEHIHFPGMLTGDAKWGAFYGSCGFFLPSHQENFGIAVAEALGCGKRVYISNQVNIYEEISSCDAGIVADNNIKGTELLIENALKDLPESDSEEYRMKSRRCFEQHFDIAKTAEKLIDLIQTHQASSDAY